MITCSSVRNKRKSVLFKGNSDFGFQIFNRVDQIPVDHWDSIVSFGSEFLQRTYLQAFEQFPPDNVRFHYAIVYKRDRPVSIAYFQVIDFNMDGFGKLMQEKDSSGSCIADYLKKHVTNHVIRVADHFNMRLLICGNACISGEHGLTIHPEVDKRQVMDALADVIYQLSLEEKVNGKIAAVLVKDFYEDALPYMHELEDYHYHDFLVEPNMIMDVHWESFDTYLADLSKKYRNRAKHIAEKGAGLVRKELSATEIGALAPELHQLYLAVHFKAEFRLATLNMNYFVEVKDKLGDAFLFEAYFFEQKLVGFRSAFILKQHVEAHFIGIDYSLNKELELYQNMLYDFLKTTILTARPKLILGRTASEIKSNIGAVAYPLTCYIRHRNPLSNRIIKPFVDYLRPSDWIPRNPFKEKGI